MCKHKELVRIEFFWELSWVVGETWLLSLVLRYSSVSTFTLGEVKL